MVYLKKELPALKKNLKTWMTQARESRSVIKYAILKDVSDIDHKMNCGLNTSSDVVTWAALFKDVKISHSEVPDVAQKAKVKWVIEGDKNSKYLHDILKMKGDSWRFRVSCMKILGLILLILSSLGSFLCLVWKTFG